MVLIRTPPQADCSTTEPGHPSKMGGRGSVRSASSAKDFPPADGRVPPGFGCARKSPEARAGGESPGGLANRGDPNPRSASSAKDFPPADGRVPHWFGREPPHKDCWGAGSDLQRSWHSEGVFIMMKCRRLGIRAPADRGGHRALNALSARSPRKYSKARAGGQSPPAKQLLKRP